MMILNLQFGNTRSEIKTFNVPMDWDDVTVEMYCNFMDLEPDESRPKRILHAITLFTGMTDREYFMMPTDERDRVLECFSFLEKKVEPTNPKSIMVGNDEYFCYFDFKKILAGEEFTIQVLSEQSHGNMLKLLPQVLCLLLRKKLPDGTLEEFDVDWISSDRPDKFAQLKIVDVLQIINSFMNTEKE